MASRVCVLPVALMLLAPTLARADALDELEPGTWYEIADTPMRAVCPPDTESFEWSYHCAGVILAWGGGVIDTARGRLVLWGGGHGDYRGNEVYTFDLQSLEWSRIWGPTADAQIPSGGTHEVYDDGNPGSRHTYSGLSYVPPPVDAMISMGGSLWQSGSFSSATWRYEFANDAWVRATEGPAEQGFGDPSVFDPQTGHVFRRTNSRMVEYDPVADTFTDRAASDGGFWAPNSSAALDPDRRLMIIVGEGRLDSYDLATDTYVQDVAIAGADVPTLFGAGAPGVDFDPVTGQFVLWGGGLDVYTYDPDAAAFSQHAGSGADPGSITASGGAFGRFRYAPSRNVFVWVDNVDANVFVFRMGEGTGVPPTGGDDGGGDTSGGDPSGGSASTGDDASDGESDGAGTAPTSGGAEVGDDTGAAGSSGTSATQDDAGGGCGCTHDRRGHVGWLLPIGIAALRRRRRLVGSVVLGAACTSDPNHADTSAQTDVGVDSSTGDAATASETSPTAGATTATTSPGETTASTTDPSDTSGDATTSDDAGAPVGEGGCAGEGEPLTDLETMIAELPADTWWAVPDSTMRAACPADLDGYHCASVVNAWSGGAWDPVHRQLLVFGGGHGDSPDNTLYAFELGTLSWTRLTERSSQDLMGADPLPDGQPVSRHSYDGLQYLTGPQRFFAWAGSRWQDGYGTNVTWMYEHDGGWTDMQSMPEGAGAYSNATAYDASTNVVLAHVGSGLQRYDVASNTWTRITDYGYPPYWPRYAVGGDKRGTIDTSRGLFFVFGGDMFLVYDIAEDAHVTDDWITQGGSTFDNGDAVEGHPEQHIVTGGGEVITAGAPGIDYDPTSDAMVAWVGGGAWRLDLPTKTWTQGTAENAPPTVNSVGGTFGRWRYVPRVNAFLLVNSVDEDVYVYKHTAACG